MLTTVKLKYVGNEKVEAFARAKKLEHFSKVIWYDWGWTNRTRPEQFAYFQSVIFDTIQVQIIIQKQWLINL